MSLLIVGGTAIDIIMTRVPCLPAWPRHSEFTPANLVLLMDAPLVTLGGNGANSAYVAARCGASVDLQTNIGNDSFGAVALGWLTAGGCRILDSRGNRRTAINMTAANARLARATFFYSGTPPTLPLQRKIPPETTHLLVSGWPHPPFSALYRWFRLLRSQGRFTAMDTGPFLGRPWILGELKPLFASLNLLLTNEYELNAITRSVDLSHSLKKLRRYFSGHVVVKRGNRGALWLQESSSLERLIPTPQVRAVNTVGAGDSFNGALMAALSRQKEFAQALPYAAKMAARVVASRRGVLGATAQ